MAATFKFKPLPLSRMRARAFILIIIWTILLIEPVSANLDIETVYSSCAEESSGCAIEASSGCSIMKEIESSCFTSKCGDENEEEPEDCEGNRCNPLMSCPTGNFYVINHSLISITELTAAKLKIGLIDDNRIATQLKECWHPPELI